MSDFSGAGEPSYVYPEDESEFGDFFSDVSHAVSNAANTVAHTVNDAGKWVGNAVNTAGKAVGQATHDVGNAVGHVASDAVKGISQVGNDLGHDFNDLGKQIDQDAKLVENTVNQLNKDIQPALDEIKHVANDIKGVVPFAQAAISLIPGVGTTISAVIGAGMALAEGQPITDALMAGVAGAIPGGPLASAAVQAAAKAVDMATSGKPLDWNTVANDAVGVAGSALGLPDDATKGIEAGITAAAGLASGQNPAQVLMNAAGTAASVAAGQAIPALTGLIPQSAVDAVNKALPANLSQTALGPVLKIADNQFQNALKKLPQEAQKAVVTGLGVALAQKHQARRTPHIQSTLPTLIAAGKLIAQKDPIAKAVNVPNNATRGFYAGLGAMSRKLNSHEFITIRNMLSQAEQTAFDSAVSLHIGRVTSPAPQGLIDPKAHAAYYMTKGMQAATPKQKVAIMQPLTEGPARAGAVTAVKEIAVKRASLWQRILAVFGIGPLAPQHA